jgi:hypothetical protein
MIRTKANATSSKPKAKATAKAKPEPVAPSASAAPAAPAGAKKMPPRAKKKPAPKRKAPKAKAKAAPQQAAPQPKVEPKPAGKPHTPGPAPKLGPNDVQRVIAMLQMCGGIKSAAAEKLNVSRQTLYSYLSDYPEAAEASAEIDEDIKDLTELKIIQAIRAGEMNTVRWFAELKMKDRGYVRRVENVGKDGGPIEHSNKLDVSKLTDEELDILIKAAERRESGEAQG